MNAIPFRPTNYDYAFRPESYFEIDEPLKRLRRSIKGETRRKLLERLVENFDNRPEDILILETLTETDRAILGCIHPSYMGGEYLPNFTPTQVEIARIVLDSTIQDVLSLRAEKSNGTASYSLVDEYEFEYTFSPSYSKKPLTFGELIELFNSVRDLSNGRESIPNMFREFFEINDSTSSAEIHQLSLFVDFQSEFYPELSAFYRDEALAWATEQVSLISLDGGANA